MAEQDQSKQAGNLERLALLYEGIFTAIVRLQSKRQTTDGSDTFRARMRDALKEIEKIAARRGYSKEHVSKTKFAIVAFLDETILSQNDSQWAARSLAEELFDTRSAGEQFFEDLQDLRTQPDSRELAEVFEVYYLCLLLGFEGKYATGRKTELRLLQENLRERIERILGRDAEFSPDLSLPDDVAAPAVEQNYTNQFKWAAAAALVFALICFFACLFQLQSRASRLNEIVQQQFSTTP